VWQYIDAEHIPVVPLYFAKEREVLVRGNTLIPIEHAPPMSPGEAPEKVMCRMRTLGCTYCSGAVRSTADTVPKIIEELANAVRSERETRIIDHDQEGSMELKKRAGYF
jgi:sulfate adenylyltransferase subunit 2